MLSTDYDWWAKRGAQYQHEKDLTADRVLSSIDRHLRGVKDSVQMVDLATPLTFWRNARSWRGAFEGWIPGSNALKHVPKVLPGLERFYMAGQWVEPGGGVPWRRCRAGTSSRSYARPWTAPSSPPPRRRREHGKRRKGGEVAEVLRGAH